MPKRKEESRFILHADHEWRNEFLDTVKPESCCGLNFWRLRDNPKSSTSPWISRYENLVSELWR